MFRDENLIIKVIGLEEISGQSRVLNWGMQEPQIHLLTQKANVKEFIKTEALE